MALEAVDRQSSGDSVIESGTEVRSGAGDVIAYSLHGNCYINLTSRCTLRCAFCPKFNKDWEVQGYPLRLRQEPSVQQILAAVGDPTAYREVVFCGLGEPTLRLPELLQVAHKLKQAGARVRLNTDGLANWVYQRNIVPELAECVDALSISLNAQDETTYNRHCRPPAVGAYPELLEFILCARELIPDITITAIDGLEGVDIAACEALAERFNVKFRRRQLDEVG
jgi:TatD family-associated radical SAM protein